MSANQINIRRKEIKKRRLGKMSLLIGLAIVVVIGITFASIFFISGDRFNFASANLEITASGKNKIIRVPKSGNLQNAINQATGGDIIELESGAVYDQIKLPKKDISDFITIRSAKSDQLPDGVRVNPSQANLMAKIATNMSGVPAVEADKAAHHYRFVGIEFTSATPEYIYNLVYMGNPQKLADVAHHMEFERCYFHPGEKGITRRGFAINSTDTIIKDSYFQGFAFPGEETQAICGWTGTKNVKILNNYIEGGAENIMFGGAAPASEDLTPQDIEVRGNHLNKPAEWKDKNAMKCLFELKNAKRVLFSENYIENNWLGPAFRITVRNDDKTAEFSTIEDAVIENNIINGSGDGMNILGTDDLEKSKMMKNLKVINNLFLNIGGEGYAGGGYFIQVSGGENILIANNTAFNNGNIANFYNLVPTNFVMRDNIVNHSEYGVHGFQNKIKSPAGQKVFQNNIVINNNNIESRIASIPPNNFFVENQQSVGFTNYSQNDFRLSTSSRFKGKAADKKDIGSNLMFKKP